MTSKIVAHLLYGLGGSATSPGIDTLATELRALGVTVRGPYDKDDWQSAASDLPRWTVEKHVVLGYSCGANDVTYICAAVAPKVVDLAVIIQGTEWESMSEIGGNVLHVLHIYNPNSLATGGLGSRVPSFSSGFRGKYEPVTNSDSHPEADLDPAVHAKILSEVKCLAE